MKQGKKRRKGTEKQGKKMYNKERTENKNNVNEKGGKKMEINFSQGISVDASTLFCG